MKTQGMSQQLEALRRSNGRTAFAYLMEQGTGKTWTILADAERNYAAGKIDALLVVAPKGVHTNWVLREIPTHLEVPHIARAWSSGMGKRARAKVEEILAQRAVGEVPPLRILTMNYGALLTKDGFAFAMQFLRSTKSMIALDESDAIKNPTALTTKRCMLLKHESYARRIADGTPITQAPTDIFSPMQFLEGGLLGTTSYRAFVAEYADVLPLKDRRVAAIIERNPRLKALAEQFKDDPDKLAKVMPQMIRRDENDEPVYRNLDKLKALLDKHSFRVLKKECLDLPDKIYTQIFFELSAKQRAAYELLEQDLRIKLDTGEIEVTTALAALVKLQQITSGYVNVNAEPIYVSEDNPRIEAVLTAAKTCRGKFIVWARFREEIAMIVRALRGEGLDVVEYHGGVGDKDRELAVDSFQTGSAQAFVANQAAGGVGLTLTAASDVIYCSNGWRLRDRLQSEDRCHRIGTKWPVRYIDIVAPGTVDESISRSMQRKTSVAKAILDDRNLAFQF